MEELGVGFHVRWPYNFFPRAIREFGTVLPDVTVKLDQFDFGDSSAGVRTSATDIGLVHLPLYGRGAGDPGVAEEGA